MNERFITGDLLTPYLRGETLADRAQALLLQQNDAWDLARDGYRTLESVKTKTFLFDGFVVKVQFNPGRLVSSSAKVDPESIRERPCFLCERSLPPEQKALPYGDDFLLLVNPFPIFDEHFTIAHVAHRPQQIAGSIGRLLDLAADLGSLYVVLYNGPSSGASAPDHLHFQAGTRSFIPIDFDYAAVKGRLGRALCVSEKLKVHAIDGYLRRFIGIESADKDVLIGAFNRLYERWHASGGGQEEPMMNILVFLDPGGWRLILFPRAKHRSSHYFREGEERILLSPGGVDLGGTCTIPAKEDFDRITRDDIVEIFEEVCLSAPAFKEFTGLVCEVLGRM